MSKETYAKLLQRRSQQLIKSSIEQSRFFELPTKEWREEIDYGIVNSVENFEMLTQPGVDFETAEEIPLDMSALSMTEESNTRDDEPTWVQMPPNKRDYIVGKLFLEIGFNPKQPQSVNRYPVFSDGQTIRVNVYKTGRSNEGIFLHEVQPPNKPSEYMLASQGYRIRDYFA